MTQPPDVPSTTEDAPAADTGASATRAPRSRRFWVVAAILSLLVAVCAIPVVMTATPRQCASCHEMKPYYDSWQQSSHAAAASNCVYCHARPGLLGWLGYEAGFYGEIVGHFTGAKVTSTGDNAPSVSSCSRGACHSLNRETSNSGGIKINHRLHVVQENIACPRCHPGAAHAGVDGRLKLPPMKLCKQCHADKMQNCRYCHSEKSLPSPGAAH
jgi:hypothetical protein